MITCIRTDSNNQDFKNLVTELDADLKMRDGDDNIFYAQLNKTDLIKHVIVAYENEMPVGCGAMREYLPNIMEVKRMYVLINKRKQGIASIVLKELEDWAAALQYDTCVLETGKRQPEAIALYTKNNYKIIPNYGKYINVENSVCFEKKLRDEK